MTYVLTVTLVMALWHDQETGPGFEHHDRDHVTTRAVKDAVTRVASRPPAKETDSLGSAGRRLPLATLLHVQHCQYQSVISGKLNGSFFFFHLSIREM